MDGDNEQPAEGDLEMFAFMNLWHSFFLFIYLFSFLRKLQASTDRKYKERVQSSEIHPSDSSTGACRNFSPMMRQSRAAFVTSFSKYDFSQICFLSENRCDFCRPFGGGASGKASQRDGF